jgi:hypothetical protein
LRGTKEILQLDWASRTSGNEDQVILPDPSDDKDLYKVELIDIGDAEVEAEDDEG